MGSEKSFNLKIDGPPNLGEIEAGNIGHLLTQNAEDYSFSSANSLFSSQNDVSPINLSVDLSNDNTKDFENIRYMLTNARSLSPKILSLVNNFDEFKLNLAIVTES